MNRIILIQVVLSVALLPTRMGFASDEPAPQVTPAEALARLKAGNARFTAGATEHPHLDQARRCLNLVDGQHPFATVLSCSDSRAPVELLFDQGIGDVFVIRVAGNVADTDEIGTIEYGVGHLGSPLVVVMGHTKCGAVTAVVDGAKVHGHIAELVANVAPAAQKARAANPDLKGPALVSEAISANVWQAIEDLILKSDEVREKVAAGKVQVVGAVYDIHSGNVQWLGEHPQQSTLLKGEAAKAPVAAKNDEPDSPEAHDAHGDTDHAHAAAPAPTPAKKADPHAAHDSHNDAHGAKDADNAHGHAPAKPALPKASSHDAESHGDGHSKAEEHDADAHGESGDDHAAATTQPAQAKVGGRNPVMLGVFLVGAAGLSGMIFKFMKTQKATTPAA